MEKEITVQELIDQLNQIENKNLPVDCTIGITGVSVIDEGSVLALESIAFRTNKYSEKPVAVSIVLCGIPKVIHEQTDEFTPIEVGKNFLEGVLILWNSSLKLKTVVDNAILLNYAVSSENISESIKNKTENGFYLKRNV